MIDNKDIKILRLTERLESSEREKQQLLDIIADQSEEIDNLNGQLKIVNTLMDKCAALENWRKEIDEKLEQNGLELEAIHRLQDLTGDAHLDIHKRIDDIDLKVFGATRRGRISKKIISYVKDQMLCGRTQIPYDEISLRFGLGKTVRSDAIKQAIYEDQHLIVIKSKDDKRRKFLSYKD